MPELPEVEVVRRGLEPHVVGRRIDDVSVHTARVLRRHTAGVEDFLAQVRGARVVAVGRRGKFLWLQLRPADGPVPVPVAGASAGEVRLYAHLGMSGQFRVWEGRPAALPHTAVRCRLVDDGHPGAPVPPSDPTTTTLDFVDQRTFGGLWIGGPDDLAHIGVDLLDPACDDAAIARRWSGRSRAVKALMLDQDVVSGIGNIYADEGLWAAGLHGNRAADRVSQRQLVALLGHTRVVMQRALVAGGTSFDPLYVNVNGRSGYFSRDLEVYGRAGEPCSRCGRAIRRTPFQGRSSHWCPGCQRPPRGT